MRDSTHNSVARQVCVSSDCNRVDHQTQLADSAVRAVVASPDKLSELLALALEVFDTSSRLLATMQMRERMRTDYSEHVAIAAAQPSSLFSAPFADEIDKQALAFRRAISRSRRMIGSLVPGGRNCIQEICERLLFELSRRLGQGGSPAALGFGSGHAFVYRLAVSLLPQLRDKPIGVSEAIEKAVLLSGFSHLPAAWKMQILDHLAQERVLLLAVTKVGPPHSTEQLVPLDECGLAILSLLAKNIGHLLSQEAICGRIQAASSRTIQRSLARLEKLGLVERPSGKRKGYTITDAGQRQLERMKESSQKE